MVKFWVQLKSSASADKMASYVEKSLTLVSGSPCICTDMWVHIHENQHTQAYTTQTFEKKKVHRNLKIKYNLKGMLMKTGSLKGELDSVSRGPG